VNAGRIVGAEVTAGKLHAYELVNGTFAEFDFPGSVYTGASDINAVGTIVGEYYTPDGVSHGYKLERGQFTTVDVPGAVYQWANGISPTGTIVGKYETPDGKFHGYELR